MQQFSGTLSDRSTQSWNRLRRPSSLDFVFGSGRLCDVLVAREALAGVEAGCGGVAGEDGAEEGVGGVCIDSVLVAVDVDLCGIIE